MKNCKNKSSVLLLERQQTNGKIRLVLQLYASGNKVQESTGIIIDPKDSMKTRNDKKRIAEDFRRKREEELQREILGVKDPDRFLDNSFFEYFERIMNEKKASTRYSWNNALSLLHDYEPNEYITFREITKTWVRGFRSFLLYEAVSRYKKRADNTKYGPGTMKVKISQNTASTMFQKLVAALNRAVADEIINVSPAKGIPGIPLLESTRAFLTEEEIQILYNTDIERKRLRDAFFFSCFTGLRFSDVSALTWDDIKQENGRFSIALRMKKTSSMIYQDISDQAAYFLGDRKYGNVFPDLKCSSSVNIYLRRWCERAGIKKVISFHCARHTFATLLLKHKTDLFTVSKLLGHRKITTTQIYAKIVDETKREAVNSLNGIIDTAK